MKKTLALILAVLVAFSMFSFATFAAEETTTDLVTITFVDGDGKVISVYQVAPGTNMGAYVPANPVKADTEDTSYTFKGWVSSVDNALLSPSTIPDADVDATYTAEYSEKKISENQTFWSFVQSIFARINLIFQYFAEIFRFD